MEVKVDEYHATLKILLIGNSNDTAGQERFRALTSTYYRGAQGVMLVYDVSNRETFEQLDNWFNELHLYCTNKEVVKMIVGNKVDKEHSRIISRKEAEAYADKTKTLFAECSAKTKFGVNEILKKPSSQRKIEPQIQVTKREVSTNTQTNYCCSNV
ncbi:7955_t:CDS:2 [Diversispora eburnea]|uniref:7955_t:CDS:1 n=1 Tax=Diversispora eburnea TaxID=1213867 RepID=A0A9N9F9T5_9GLOM|nr:7955_t:CDS:2 [Diversispora eburnea]